MSKGSKQRPGTGFAEGWERIFGKSVEKLKADGYEFKTYGKAMGSNDGGVTWHEGDELPDFVKQEHWLYEDGPIAVGSDLEQIRYGVLKPPTTRLWTDQEIMDYIAKGGQMPPSDKHLPSESPSCVGKYIGTAHACGNCKHWEKYLPSDRTASCQNISICDMMDDGCCRTFEAPSDFGCNKWEPKP